MKMHSIWVGFNRLVTFTAPPPLCSLVFSTPASCSPLLRSQKSGTSVFCSWPCHFPQTYTVSTRVEVRWWPISSCSIRQIPLIKIYCFITRGDRQSSHFTYWTCSSAQHLETFLLLKPAVSTRGLHEIGMERSGTTVCIFVSQWDEKKTCFVQILGDWEWY